MSLPQKYPGAADRGNIAFPLAYPHVSAEVVTWCFSSMIGTFSVLAGMGDGNTTSEALILFIRAQKTSEIIFAC